MFVNHNFTQKQQKIEDPVTNFQENNKYVETQLPMINKSTKKPKPYFWYTQN